MAIFGKKTARQRLQRATRESLTIPAFSSPVDCTPWVIGGLWPAELATVTDDTAALADYLRADLQRIADAANIELQNIRRAVLADKVRQAAEARVVNGARAFATRRVESTVRHLRKAVPEWPNQYLRLTNSDQADGEMTAQFAAGTEDIRTDSPGLSRSREPIDSACDGVEPAEPRIDEVDRPLFADPSDAVSQIPNGRHVSAGRHAATPIEQAVLPGPAEPAAQPESDEERLHRLLRFVARQEPGLRWAVGDRADGTTVVVTDLAHGWIPPGIVLPAGVGLLTPERRTGNATALLGPTTRHVAYTPGGPLGGVIEPDAVADPAHLRELPMVDDLGWLLGEATHWRDGLPRMVHTLAKAGAAGTGVVEAELELLRVYLDTARYQVLAQYPDVDAALLLNCLLLAATEGIAGADLVTANYHFSWFQRLSAPPVSRWTTNP